MAAFFAAGELELIAIKLGIRERPTIGALALSISLSSASNTRLSILFYKIILLLGFSSLSLVAHIMHIMQVDLAIFVIVICWLELSQMFCFDETYFSFIFYSALRQCKNCIFWLVLFRRLS
jgi:hypothetical protein